MITLSILSLSLCLQGAQNQPSTQECKSWKSKLADFEKQLLPENKQALLNDYRSQYKDALSNLENELNYLQTQGASQTTLINWYKDFLNKTIATEKSVINNIEKNLDPRNSKSVLAQEKEFLEVNRLALERLLEQADSNEKKGIQQELTKINNRLKLSDKQPKQLLDYVRQQEKTNMRNAQKKLNDSQEKLNSKDLATLAKAQLDTEIERVNKEIKNVQSLLASDDQLYKEALQGMDMQIAQLEQKLKQCK